MRKVFFGIILAVVIVFGLRYCEHKKEEKDRLVLSSSIIEKQLQNVGKLIVTEGNYAQIFSYEDSKKFYTDVFSQKKKALVIVNATAHISYDLSKIITQVDQASKSVTIVSIPEPELSINPDIEYYDIQQGYFNQFEASDYNKIKKRVNDSLRQKINASNLRKNAENRLISELQKIYILTNSMGWELRYNGGPIENEAGLDRVLL